MGYRLVKLVNQLYVFRHMCLEMLSLWNIISVNHDFTFGYNPVVTPLFSGTNKGIIQKKNPYVFALGCAVNLFLGVYLATQWVRRNGAQWSFHLNGAELSLNSGRIQQIQRTEESLKHELGINLNCLLMLAVIVCGTVGKMSP